MPRTVIWSLLLLAATGLSAAWAALPALDASPLLRVLIGALLGLLAIPLVFLFPDLPRRKAAWLVLGAALLLRLPLLVAPHSDDVHRYLWEARLVLAGENPYAVTADHPARAAFRDADWQRMNHRDRPTAYPPGILAIMAGAVALDDHPRIFKALAVAADLLVVLLLLSFLNFERAPPRWAGLYAFSPIALLAFAAEAHFDSLLAAAILGFVLTLRRDRWKTAAVCLAAAVQIKIVALVLTPLLLIALWKNKRSAAFAVFGILALAPFIPYLPSLVEALATFGGGSHFNGPLFSLFSLLQIPEPAIRPLCLLVLLAGSALVVAAHLRRYPLIDAALALLGLLLVCSPIVHFWYLAWLLPLTALRPSFAWATAGITFGGYFLAWRTEDLHGWWGYGHGTTLLIWLPAAIAFILQNRAIFPRIKAALAPSGPAGGSDLTIVIPTLNPGPELPRLVSSLNAEAPSAPIVITDASPEPPSFPPARTITAPRGRGNQIAAATGTATTEWIAIIHADALPAPGWHDCLQQAILAHPEASMFVMGQRFSPAGYKTLLIEFLNEIRLVFGGVAFGDQTMIIRRPALEAGGGFPAQPLMEDVEVSLRLLGRGRLIYLGHEWRVDASKWRRAFPTRFGLVIRLVTTYQLARLRGPAHAATFAERLYREYYPGVSK